MRFRTIFAQILYAIFIVAIGLQLLRPYCHRLWAAFWKSCVARLVQWSHRTTCSVITANNIWCNLALPNLNISKTKPSLSLPQLAFSVSKETCNSSKKKTGMLWNEPYGMTQEFGVPNEKCQPTMLQISQVKESKKECDVCFGQDHASASPARSSALHHNTLHDTRAHYTARRFAVHGTARHDTTLHYTTLNYTALHYTPPH